VEEEHELGDVLGERDVERADVVGLEALGGLGLEGRVVVVGVPLVQYLDADDDGGLDGAGGVDDGAGGVGAERLVEVVRRGRDVVDERAVVVDQRGVELEALVDAARGARGPGGGDDDLDAAAACLAGVAEGDTLDVAVAVAADGALGRRDVVVGPGRPIDTRRWFVVCPNVLGGCRGSTGPGSTDTTSASTPKSLR